jgi:hypothetical protein
MRNPLPATLLAAFTALMWCAAAPAADIGKRTAIVCVFEETRSLTAFAEAAEGSKADKVRSWFTEWLFSSEGSSGSARIRFLWIPQSESGSKLRVDSKDTHHVLVRLMSQTGNSVVAASSASDILTSVGWLFAINFKLEQVLATSVRSNAAGIQSQAVRLSCTFDSDTPRAGEAG